MSNNFLEELNDEVEQILATNIEVYGLTCFNCENTETGIELECTNDINKLEIYESEDFNDMAHAIPLIIDINGSLGIIDVNKVEKKLSLYTSDEMKNIITIDVSDGYTRIIPGKSKNSIGLIKIKYTDYQKNYKKDDLDLYPMYSIHMNALIDNSKMFYRIVVDMMLSPIESLPYSVKVDIPYEDMDKIDNAATNLYNMIIAKDFLQFFTIDKFKLGNSESKVQLTIDDKHYDRYHFTAKSETGEIYILPYLYYFTGLIDTEAPVLFEDTEENVDILDKSIDDIKEE